MIAGCKSADSQQNFGVPQGSVLGPKMYYNPLGEIITQNGFKYHCCAEDSLVYTTLKQGGNTDEAVHATENSLADISIWMENLIRINKTELIVSSSKWSVKKSGKFYLKLGSSCIIGKKSWHYLRQYFQNGEIS